MDRKHSNTNTSLKSTKTCKSCGKRKDIKQFSHYQRSCNQCLEAKSAPRPVVMRFCKQCGEPIPATRAATALYCSDSCKVKSRQTPELNAIRNKKYREKIKSNPDEYERYLAASRERVKAYLATEQGSLKRKEHRASEHYRTKKRTDAKAYRLMLSHGWVFDQHVRDFYRITRGQHDSHVKAFRAYKRTASPEWLDWYYNEIGKPWLNPLLSNSEKYKTRYHADHEFQIKERMRNQIRKVLRRDSIGDSMRTALNNNGASNAVEHSLGYTISELRQHIERQFIDGMSWESFRHGDIHIDHIVPKTQFDMSIESEWQACWHLTNLRPMWAKENIRKSNKVLTLL